MSWPTVSDAVPAQVNHSPDSLQTECSRNANSQLNPVFEHLVGRQNPPMGAQMRSVCLSDQKGWSQDLALPRPSYGLVMEATVFCWRFLPTWALLNVSKFTSFFFFFFFCCCCCCCCCIWTFPCLLHTRTLPTCNYCCTFHHIIVLHWRMKGTHVAGGSLGGWWR